jgi:membrane-bound lytic murein transglycosylase B
MIPEIILSTLISLTPAEKGSLKNLEKRIKRDGYDISQYTNDPRFQIYKFERGKKSTNYADPNQSWYTRKDSLEKCADFIEEQYHWLKMAEEKYGPSPEQITSQLELETNRGQYTGERPLINSFISVYLSRPDRRKEFYRYIIDFLDLFSDTTDNIVLPREIFDIKGSWAGAYGIAQGMPGIIKKYGKNADGDGDGVFNPMNMPDAIDFLALYLSDHGFSKNQSGAIQKYNHGHPFYGSSIGKHTKELVKIMEKRARIPPKKIAYKIKPTITNIQYPPRDNLQNMKIIAMTPQIPQKQHFIKRIVSNLKIGRR